MSERLSTCFAVFARLPAVTLLGLIRLYQRVLSPALRVAGGPTCGCRFTPSCSHYAAEAVATHGALAGVGLAVLRLLKCTPLHPGGFDPVPAPRLRTCVRLAHSSPLVRLSAATAREIGSPIA